MTKQSNMTKRSNILNKDISRRSFGGLMGAASAALFCAPARAALPTSPVTLSIIDVCGNFALSQAAMNNYAAAKPQLVSRFAFTQAPAPELPAKIKAQQQAGRVDIDLVLTGTDALAAGIAQDLWLDLLPARAAELPKPEEIFQEPALRMQGIAQGKGVVIAYYPSGPLLEYVPARVAKVPATAEELLAYTKENKNRFMHARPANSGPARTFLMGMPYILGDKDPKDPVKGWDKTWAYLKELGENIEYYPSGTGATMKELGEGSRDMIASTTGWDINPRVLGIVPKEAAVARLSGMHWVADAHYMVVPKGIAEEKLAVVLDLMSFLLQPAQQAYAFDKGYFYPGPAVKNVTLDMAPPESQAALKEYGRPEYESWIAEAPIETPLAADMMVVAFKRWDEEIGGAKKKS